MFYKHRTVWAARDCYGLHPTQQGRPAIPTPMPAELEDPRALLGSKSTARALVGPPAHIEQDGNKDPPKCALCKFLVGRSWGHPFQNNVIQ